jgi:4-hydroxy-tetrahydrodipicolinate reductase
VKDVDVIIDFTHFSIVDDLLNFAETHKIPLVVCTTGLENKTEDHIKEVAKTIPVFKSGNMSLGINVLLELAKLGAQSLAGFDIEIIEKHHNLKVDAPSGTAFMIADKIKEARKGLSYTHGREGLNTKREPSELGIHAIRGGTITGEHTVLFAGIDEVVELKHQATSKAVFAKGAIEAAFYLIGKEAGLYNMTDLILGGK